LAHNGPVRRHSAREVDVDTEAGTLRIGLWSDGWVLAMRRDGAQAGEEVFDVFARGPSDLVGPLIDVGISEPAAQRLAEELVEERASMDREGQV
jgi:hypothetical protein